MARHPDLTRLDGLFASGGTIRLTDADYESMTGRALPKDTNYLLKRSAIARKCQESGYSIRVIEKQIIMEKKES